MENKIGNIKSYLDDIKGLPVSLAWKGHGSAIFLELGELEKKRQIHENGEVSIYVSWDWRFELGKNVLFGSSNSSPEINKKIKEIKGKVIDNVKITGAIAELEVAFTDSTILRSMIMVDYDPEWSIRIKNGQHIYAKNGSLYIGDGVSELTEIEKAEFGIAEETTKRWGIPISEPKMGTCTLCSNFRYIDGEANFLDYGVCISEGGVFDGRIVNVKSGCPSFRAISTAFS